MAAAEKPAKAFSRRNVGAGVGGFLTTLLLLFGCSGDPALRPATLEEGSLPPCPDKPNCVSTRSPDPARRMEPLPFVGTREETRNRILEIVRGMDRSEVLQVSDSTVHALFRSRLFRFVDDVLFLFDEAERLVHFRSASRVGTYDFGANRRRMEEISRRYRDRRP